MKGEIGIPRRLVHLLIIYSVQSHYRDERTAGRATVEASSGLWRRHLTGGTDPSLPPSLFQLRLSLYTLPTLTPLETPRDPNCS